MIRLIYFLFKSQILKLQYGEQSKKKGFEKLTQVFIDSKGKRYYRYPNDMDIPILRKGALEKCLMEIESGLSGNELERILTAMSDALNERKGDRMIPNIAKVGFLVEEIRNRKNLLLHPDLLFEAVSILYIREDEDPAKVDGEVMNQKLVQLKEDSREGLYDFFYTSGLSAYIPFLGKSEDEWMEYYQEGIVKMEAMKKFLSTSEQESLTT